MQQPILESFPYSELPYFSPLIQAFLTESEAAKIFYRATPPLLSQPRELAALRSAFAPPPRQVLADTLLQQYEALPDNDLAVAQIQHLRSENTFTVCTGHQCCLAGGPLYLLYKALHIIKVADFIKEQFPDLNIVPVFWLNSEDHDFAEINHFFVFGKKIEWTSPPLQGAAAGTLSTVGLASLLDETEAILGNAPFAAETMELLRRAYLAEGATMTSATRFLLHHWLGKYGLVVLDASAAALKKEASFLIQNELQHGEQTEALIAAQSRALEQAGFHAQAKPRALNLFYFENGQRKRIIYEAASDTFAIHDSMLQFSPQNMAQEIALHPERFSFNVITRPLYQQYILPNLAYIGGGGEIAYWLQLKTLFEARQIFFPALMLRHSYLWTDAGSRRKMDKLQLGSKDLFNETESLLNEYVRRHSSKDISLEGEKTQLQQLFETLVQKAGDIDKSLLGAVEGEKTKMLNGLDNLAAKFLRAEKRRHDESSQQIRQLKEKLFPNQSLQERTDSLIQYYAQYGAAFIENCYQITTAHNEAFVVVAMQ